MVPSSAIKRLMLILLMASTVWASQSGLGQGEIAETGSAKPSLRGGDRRRELEGDSFPKRRPRIIGGQVADSGRFPYYALMNGSNLCGAVLISPRFALTAAHCQDADRDFAIFSQTRKIGTEIGVVDRAVHPLYDDFTYSNDVAIFELSEDATDEDGTPAPFVRLSPTEIDTVGTAMTVIGYGDVDPDEDVTKFSDNLNRVDVRYITNPECNRDHRGEISEEMMCAEDTGRDACYGDSGGPLLLTPDESDFNQDVMVGIVSWGRGCADAEFPGVYTRISYFYDWIVGTMCVLNAEKVPPYVDCVEILGIDVTDPNDNVDNREEELLEEDDEQEQQPSPQEEVDDSPEEEVPPVTEPPRTSPPTPAPVPVETSPPTPAPITVETSPPTPVPVSLTAPCGGRNADCTGGGDCCSGRCNIFSKKCYPPSNANRDRISSGMGGSAGGVTLRRIKNVYAGASYFP